MTSDHQTPAHEEPIPGTSVASASVTSAMRNLSLESNNPRRSTRPVRFNDPTPFSGKTEDVRTFITQVKIALRLNHDQFEDDLDKICYMTSFMTGAAYEWAQPMLEDIDSDEMDPCLTSFPLFLEAFRTAFGQVNELIATENALLELRQRSTPASEHSATFRRLAVRTDFNERALLAIFRQSLSDRLKDALATRDMPNSLWDYVSMVIELDNRIREREGEKRNHPVRPRQKFSAPVRSPYQAREFPQPMDIDAAKVRKFTPLSPEEKARRFQNNLCLYCGEAGHAAATCPNKKGKGRTQGL